MQTGKECCKSVDRIVMFRSASDLKECARCSVQRVIVVMLRCCVCGMWCGCCCAAVAGWCCVGLQKSITCAELSGPSGPSSPAGKAVQMTV